MFCRCTFRLTLSIGLAFSINFLHLIAQVPKVGNPALTPPQLEKLKECDRLIQEFLHLGKEGKFKEAISAYRKVIEINRDVYGPNHASVETTIKALATYAKAIGQYDAARQALEELVEWRTRNFGKDGAPTKEAKQELADLDKQRDLIIAKNLNHEAIQLLGQGKNQEALEKYLELAAIRKRILGEKHQDYAEILYLMATIHTTLDQFVKAEPLYVQALDIRKSTLGEKHPDYFLTLRSLARVYRALMQYDKSEPLFQKALEIRKEKLGEKHLDYADCLDDLALGCRLQNRYNDAAELYQKVLGIRKELVGENHPLYVKTLEYLSATYQELGDYPKAEQALLRLIDIQKSTIGEKHPDHAKSLSRLATLYTLQSQYAKAESLYYKALAIYKDASGEQNSNYALTLSLLGLLYDSQFQPAKAEELHLKAMRIYAAVVGEKHIDYARCLHNLALHYDWQLQHDKVLGIRQKILEILKETRGDKHPEYANALIELAFSFRLLGQWEKAEPLCLKALEILKNAPGENRVRHVACLTQLASVYRSQKQYSKAEPYYLKALEIQEQLTGEKHLSYVRCLSDLASLYGLQGHYAKGEPLFLKAQKIDAAIRGEGHPDSSSLMHDFARFYSEQGLHTKAVPLYLQVIRTQRQLLNQSAAAQSEQQQQFHAHYLRIMVDNLCLILSERKFADVGPIYAEVLACKGAITSRQRQTRLVRTILQNNPDAETTRILADLDGVSRKLAALSHAQPDPQHPSEGQKSLKDLFDHREQLEKDLSRKTEVYRRHRETKDLTPANLQKLLPEGAALIDFLEYRDIPDFLFRRPEGRLVAFIITAKTIQYVDYGRMEPFAAAVNLFRSQLKQSQPIQARDDPALFLRDKLWQPLEKYIAGSKQILISPDGPLNGLPFAALPTKDGDKLLIEAYPIAVLPVPQLLPELLERKMTDDQASALLVGGVAFDGDVKSLAVASSSWATRSGQMAKWAELPGTTREVEALGQLFSARFPAGKSTVLQKAMANEDAIRNEIGRHRWIHLATHGYFTPSEVKSARLSDSANNGNKLVGHDPRLLSGIVLAGANRRPEIGQDDGILTALEVGELDLTKVELAVLSACETGLGEVAGGEGVLGLQRAFQTAGAGSVITTLWQIPDEPTRILMERFYENLWKGRDGKKFSKLEALREAQLWMLKEGKAHPGIARGLVRDDLPPPTKDGRLPPYYWAAFVLSGDWR